MATSLEIKKNADGENLTLEVCGRVDTITAPQLEEEIKASINGVSSLVFDMAGLKYISSAGLRVLLSTQKIMNRQGEMVLKNVNDDIMEIFDVTGFVDILTIEN